MEHFGRGIETNIDTVLLAVEPSYESISLAERIQSLATGIEKNVWAVLDKIVSDDLALKLRAE